MHTSIAGTKDAIGVYLSKSTAQYPPLLACEFADIVIPLISGPGHDLTFAEAMNLLPTKTMRDHPQAFQDGVVYFPFQIGRTSELHMVIFLVTFGTRCSSSYEYISKEIELKAEAKVLGQPRNT